jgi:hypothetical protein
MTSLINDQTQLAPISMGKERDPFHLKEANLRARTRLLNRKVGALSGILAQ